ncbi:MAG: 16S rRNA (cytidine(1402)-2'-O)-methyltransferase [Vulcanimicrobiaceae bacterium]
MSLTFVPTPLGNLRDITLRALDALRDCDLLVAEDTRVARRLLAALDLPSKPIWSYREQNAAGATAGILERARLERVVAVSDAGTPGISDPGSALVVAARAAGVAIEVLPGPAAFVCAVVLSGFDTTRFAFEGFVPRPRAERERALRAARASGATSVWYESPKRIVETLKHLAQLAPAGDVFVARELTKRFEQQILGRPHDVAAALERPVRGEIVLVLAPAAPESPRALDASELDAAIERELAAGKTAAHVARDLAHRGFGERAAIYRAVSERPRRAGGERHEG